MDSTADVLSEQPWGQTYREIREGYRISRYIPEHKDMPVRIVADFKLVRDSNRGYWKRGDIIRFKNGFHDWQFRQKNPWKEWFLETEDYIEALKKDAYAFNTYYIPDYARLQFGMLISRYKWIKAKPHGVFRDYGSIIIMLTGSKPGHIRRYYARTPYEFISRFPYNHIMPYHKQQGITKIPEIKRIKELMKISKDKDHFILNMIESFK